MQCCLCDVHYIYTYIDCKYRLWLKSVDKRSISCCGFLSFYNLLVPHRQILETTSNPQCKDGFFFEELMEGAWLWTLPNIVPKPSILLLWDIINFRVLANSQTRASNCQKKRNKKFLHSNFLMSTSYLQKFKANW